MGKSELAREFARRERKRYQGGILFLDASKDAIEVELARVGKTILEIDFSSDRNELSDVLVLHGQGNRFR